MSPLAHMRAADHYLAAAVRGLRGDMDEQEAAALVRLAAEHLGLAAEASDEPGAT